MVNKPKSDEQAHTGQNGDDSTVRANGSATLLSPRRVSHFTHSQSRLAHQRIKMKQTPKTREATLLATMSNPQNTSSAPMRLDPK